MSEDDEVSHSAADVIVTESVHLSIRNGGDPFAKDSKAEFEADLRGTG